ncbi:MAG: MGMT family protein [Candidatus Levybacteria bacterium]|nr:MGMT family protein [Candidatus Levybacteria bacterium]
MSNFKEKVMQVVRLVPFGNVVSYGQVAAYVGVPRGARHVGWILRGIENNVDLPWWRVVNNTGRISIDGNLHSDKHLQRKLLEAEGIEVLENFKLDIKKYRFIPQTIVLKKLQLKREYIQMLQDKYFQVE